MLHFKPSRLAVLAAVCLTEGAALCLAALLASSAADATLINEGNYTLDTDTGLEWLNLSFTAGRSYDTVAPDAAAYGWRVATVLDFLHLGHAYLGTDSRDLVLIWGRPTRLLIRSQWSRRPATKSY